MRLAAVAVAILCGLVQIAQAEEVYACVDDGSSEIKYTDKGLWRYQDQSLRQFELAVEGKKLYLTDTTGQGQGGKAGYDCIKKATPNFNLFTCQRYQNFLVFNDGSRRFNRGDMAILYPADFPTTISLKTGTCAKK